MADLKDGAKAIQRLSESLERSGDLAGAFAKAILSEAQQRAQSKPTPQSRMAADAMGVQGSEIRVLSEGTPAGEVSGGSEWGSNIYRQFGPRNEGGYWLHPAAESQEVLDAGDRYLDQLAEQAARSRF